VQEAARLFDEESEEGSLSVSLLLHLPFHLSVFLSLSCMKEEVACLLFLFPLLVQKT